MISRYEGSDDDDGLLETIARLERMRLQTNFASYIKTNALNTLPEHEDDKKEALIAEARRILQENKTRPRTTTRSSSTSK